MKFFVLFSFCWGLPFLAFSQDYKQYINLNYAEIDSLVMIPYQKGDFSECLFYMQAGREKANNEFGEQDSVFAEYTANLGFFYHLTGQYDKALPLFIQAKKIRAKVLGTQHFSYATSLNNLAYLLLNMGNYEEALPLFIQAINIEKKVLGTEHVNVTNSLNNLAILHQKMGNYDKALPLFIQSKNIREKTLGPEHSQFAQSLNNIAAVHSRMGDYDKALPLLIQAKKIRKKAVGTEHPDFTESLNNLAFLHSKMGNYEEALSLFVQTINIREKVLGTEHPHFSLSLNNLATLYMEMGNYEEALALFTQTINTREKVLGIKHPDYATSLNVLAKLHIKMGNYSLAWNQLDLAMNSLSSLKLKHTFNNNWLDSLKTAFYPSNLHIKHMVIALKTAYLLLEKDGSITNSKAKQAIIADLATELLSKARNQVSNDKDKLRMLSLSNDWLLRSLEVLNPEVNTQKAFNRSDQNKSVLLLQATKSEAAYRLGELPDSLIWQDKKLLKKQSQLQAKLIERRSKTEKDSLRDELIHVNQDIDDFIKIIAKNHPKYHKLKYQPIQAKVEAVQALLDDNTALLEYVIGDSTVHIFCVNHKKVQWKKIMIDTAKLNSNISQMHQALSDYAVLMKDNKEAYNNYTIQAHWFYQTLIAPALADQSNIKNIIIVPDGELGHLPFETFLIEPAPQEGTDYHKLHYLVSDYNISYNYSATLWKENKEAPAPKNNGQIFGIAANYKIKLDSSLMDIRLPTDQWMRETLNPLPDARKEVETLQKNYQGFFAFDTLASEKMVKEKVGNYAILHFATHGILNAKRPILSSLALTEDNDSIESNFWQAHEISKIELNANLVVLSACETGFGKFEKGNGIASLARAFMYAGASSLIVSLWQVNDYATSEIMKNLYANLAHGMKIDEALRKAKLQYMKTAKGIMAHPAFWSPFIQMGNTRPVSIKKKGNPMVWGIGIGVLALLGIGGFLIKRKGLQKK